jgi:hypothetical protein
MAPAAPKKRQFKAQASSASAWTTGFDSAAGFSNANSALSYLAELPDLSSISDANIVVAFKNLSKRDSVTKGKALEDLQSLLSAEDSQIEDSVLEAWTSIYPRTSIDDSRRVRQLAHSTQGQICLRSGKRIAKYMPRTVGAWLAGLYDNDKLVAKAAGDALLQIFSTLEKRQAVWKAYQQPILEFCRNVFDKESSQTLSDERIINKDEANAKYYRVVTAAIGLLSNLVSAVKVEDYQKYSSEYEELLQDKKLWEFALSEDASVRRSVHKTCRTLMQAENAKSSLDIPLIAAVYLSKGLDSDQTGSASDFVETVMLFTESDPTIWADRWSSKRSQQSRLKSFVKRGSQAANLNYWTSVSALFGKIPAAALPSDLAGAQDLLKSLHGGITKKDEPRAFIANGLRSYVEVAGILCQSLSTADKLGFFKETVLPLVLQYMRPNPDSSQWDIPGARAADVVMEAMHLEGMPAVMEGEWPSLSDRLVQDLKEAPPEDDAGYKALQNRLSKEGDRYAVVLESLIGYPQSESAFKVDTANVVEAALQECTNQDGRAVGAAAVASSIVRRCKPLLPPHSSVLRFAEDWVQKQLPLIYSSPSVVPFASLLFSFNDCSWFSNTWLAVLEAIINADSPQGRLPSLKELLIHRHVTDTGEIDRVRQVLAPSLVKEAEVVLDTAGNWAPLVDVFSRSALASSVAAEPVLSVITKSLLTLDSKTIPSALNGLENFTKSSPSLVRSFLATEQGKRLLPNILLLTESHDDNVAQSASSLNTILHSNNGNVSTSESHGHSMLEVLTNGLQEAGRNSVSVDTLVLQAQNLIQEKKVASIGPLLPSLSAWSGALQPFMDIPASQMQPLAIIHPLSGAAFLAESESHNSGAISRDTDSYSIPLRMALYCTRLLRTSSESLGPPYSDVYRYLALTLQLANDNLSVSGSTNLWSMYNPETEAEMAEFVSECQKLLSTWLHDSDVTFPEVDETAGGSFIGDAAQALFDLADSLRLTSYYSAQAYAATVGEIIELHGWQKKKLSEIESQLRHLSKVKSLRLHAFLVAYQVPLSTSAVAARICNELIAELDALNIETKTSEVLWQLVFLNGLIQTQILTGSTIAKQRLVRFVRKAVAWLDNESLTDQLRAEICRVLSALLPSMSDMYGDHWSGILAPLISFWNEVQSMPDKSRPALLPAIHASLKLYNTILSLKSGEEGKEEDERNDDLIDACLESQQDAAESLLQMVKLPRDFPDEMHQPLRIVNELLSRQAVAFPGHYITGTDELYPQIYSQSRSIQEAAFSILHKDIPRHQEEVSLNAALDKKVARLPDELLSLILEVPTMAGLENEDFERTMPLSLRGYLFSWILVFDHFEHSVS